MAMQIMQSHECCENLSGHEAEEEACDSTSRESHRGTEQRDHGLQALNDEDAAGIALAD
jgi:hypothetical protein